MAGIGGIGSGIDIDSIITAMVNAEKAPKTNQLDRLETKATTQFSALGSLRSSLSGFQSALTKLNKISLFEGRTATATPTDYFSASATSTAPAGSYSLSVQQLAAGSKVALKSFVETASAPTTFSGGTLTLYAGDPADSATTKLELNIDSSNNTLAGIRDAINEQGASSGFSASIVTDASGSRLVLNSSNMGDGKDIRTVVSNPAALGVGETDLAGLAFAPVSDGAGGFVAPDSTVGGGAAGVIGKAASARLTVDGLQVVRNSNSITGAIEGVTLTLTKADPDKTVSLNVGADKSTVKSSLNEFISAYNTLAKTMASLTAVVDMGEDNAPSTGPLVGDSMVRGLQSGIRSAMSQMDLGAGGIQALAQLGVTTQEDGTLKLDQTKLDAALANDFDGVAQYLAGENGLMGRLGKAVDGYIKTDGVIDQRQASLQKTLTNVDDQRDALDRRIETMQKRLVAQYTAMDTLIANLTSTSSWLSTQLSSLPGVVKNNGNG